jgi:hypothetical protein
VYNLTIQDLHTYFVLVGGTAVLVHNDYPVPLPNQKTRGKTQLLTHDQTDDLAKYLGYRATKGKIKGQTIYTNGKSFISQDVDTHNGGTWKTAKKEKDLGSKSTRGGTTDPLLNVIGC